MPPEDDNPVLKAVDEALDLVENFITAKVKAPFKTIGLGLVSTLRDFLKVPDNYAGDLD